MPVGKGIAGLTVERGEHVDLRNLQTDAGGSAVGALGIGTAAEHTFTREEIALLNRVAEHASRLMPYPRSQ